MVNWMNNIVHLFTCLPLLRCCPFPLLFIGFLLWGHQFQLASALTHSLLTWIFAQLNQLLWYRSDLICRRCSHDTWFFAYFSVGVGMRLNRFNVDKVCHSCKPIENYSLGEREQIAWASARWRGIYHHLVTGTRLANIFRMKWCGNLSINLFLRSSTPPTTTTTHLVRRGRLSISVPRCHRLNYKLIVTPLRSQTMRKKQYKVQHVAVINQGSCFGGATMLRLYGSTDTPTSLGAATTAMAAATLTNFARQPQHTIIAFCSQVKTVLHLVFRSRVFPLHCWCGPVSGGKSAHKVASGHTTFTSTLW